MQTINVGTAPNSGDGEAIRTAFQKVNSNFEEIYLQTLQNITDNTFYLKASGVTFAPIKLSSATIFSISSFEICGTAFVHIIGDGNSQHIPTFSLAEDIGDLTFDYSDNMANVYLFCYDGNSFIYSLLRTYTYTVPDPIILSLTDLSFSSISNTTAIFNFTSNKAGYIKYGVKESSALTPTKQEILTGTDCINFGSKYTSGNTDTINITGLSKNTEYILYYYTINGSNVESDIVITIPFSTTNALSQLATPTLNTPTVVSSTELQVTWSTVSNVSSWKLEYSLEQSTWIQIGGTISAATLSYNHTGLTANTTYYYRLTAIGDGVDYSNSNISSIVSKNTGAAVYPAITNSYSLKHNANTSYLSLPTDGTFDFASSGVDQPFSLTFWLYVPTGLTNFGTIFTDIVSGGTTWSKYINIASNVLKVQLYSGSGSNYIEVDTAFATKDTWLHVGIVYRGTGLNTGLDIYINGVNQTVSRLSGGTYTSMGLARVPKIGYNPYGGSAVGYSDEWAFWNKAFSSAEMLEEYNTGIIYNKLLHSANANLLAWYRAENNALDSSGNSHNATASGSIVYETTIKP